MDEKIISNPQTDVAVEDVTADREDVKTNYADVPVDEFKELGIRVVGVVSDCLKLNIRKEPSMSAPVIATVPVDTEVEIDPEKLYETNEWFYIYTAAGIEGYCVAEYIKTP